MDPVVALYVFNAIIPPIAGRKITDKAAYICCMLFPLKNLMREEKPNNNLPTKQTRVNIHRIRTTVHRVNLKKIKSINTMLNSPA